MRIISRITGTERVQKQLDVAVKFAKQGADPVFRLHARREAGRLRKKPYPPELPNQKYQRTFELRDSYRHRKTGPSNYAITTQRKGAKWVVKKGMQNRRYHFGRWWTVDDEIAKGLPALSKRLSVEIEDIMEHQ
jgi:hypothetical protein